MTKILLPSWGVILNRGKTKIPGKWPFISESYLLLKIFNCSYELQVYLLTWTDLICMNIFKPMTTHKDKTCFVMHCQNWGLNTLDNSTIYKVKWASDKNRLFFSLFLFYFGSKTQIWGTHLGPIIKTVLMSTHNQCLEQT